MKTMLRGVCKKGGERGQPGKYDLQYLQLGMCLEVEDLEIDSFRNIYMAVFIKLPFYLRC